MILRRLSVLLLLLSVCGCFFSCDVASDLVEADHQHEYHLHDTVIGTCVAPGRQTYSCSCGDSFHSVVPAPHELVIVSDITGSYFKELCTVCGVYTITREQEYIYNIDFEGAKDYKDAAEQEMASCFRAGGKVGEPVRLELVEDMGDISLKSTDSNYYVLDKSEIVKGGEDFVVSMDVRFMEHGRASIFTILCHFEGKSDFSYNGGLVFIEKDGRLSTVNDGDRAYYKDVCFSEDGYDTVTVKGSLGTGLYDVYLNEQLVRKDVVYVSAQTPVDFVCLRYFDVQNTESYTGYADNLKLYQASSPEFVIEEAIFEADDHSHAIAEEVIEPTCMQSGSKKKVCTVCHEEFSVETLALVDHVASEAATCTKDAVCKFCGIVLTKATGHTVTDYTETNAQPGYKKGNCSVCGAEVIENIPVEVIEDFENFPVGELTAKVMTENSAFGSDFTYTVKAGVFEVVDENGNRYVKKLAPDGKIQYKGAMNAKTMEISVDLRLSELPREIKGLISLWGDTEMRILSVMKGARLSFGLGDFSVGFASYEADKWFNVKIVVNTETFDYEIYIDGEKMLETETDPNSREKHLIYIRDGGTMVRLNGEEDYNAEKMHDGSQRSPFILNGDALTGIEFFHWTKDFTCAMDNFTLRFINE